MLTRTILLISIIIVSLTTFAQVAPGVYLIEFTDKENSSFNISQPDEFLSQRAIERRARYDISISENDLPVNQVYIDSIENLGIHVRYASKWFNSVVADIDDLSVITALQQISFVKNVSKKSSNIKSRKVNKFIDEEIVYPTISLNKKISIVQENVLDYGLAFHQISMLNGQYLHNKGLMGENMIIAVNDAGFYRADIMIAFDSLRNSNRILGTKDFVEFDDSVYNDHYHGSYVLSLIAANNPGVAIGTAPHAQFYLLGTENNDSEFIIEEENWIAAAEFADSAGVDIITTSLGYSHFDDSLQNHTYEEITGNTTRITKAADIAASKGMLVLNSAGNEGNNDWRYISFPADADSIITVGAVDSLGNIASFSSIGYPGFHIVKPNVVAQGVRVFILGTNDFLVQSSGTSFSTPIIAGLAACLWQNFPEQTNYEIIKAIEQSAHLSETPNGYYGYGIPDFAKAYHILEGTVDVSDVDKIDINIYPNPFNDQLKVEIQHLRGNNINVSITDIFGKQIYVSVLESNSSYTEFLLHEFNVLPAGMYFLRINSGNQELTKKIMKIK